MNISSYNNNDYRLWIEQIKIQIKQSQIKAVVAVNSELIFLYWEIGKQIVEKQKTASWGSGLIEQISSDLREEFPELTGFSAKNLRYCRAFYSFYSSYQIQRKVVADSIYSIWQQPVAEIQQADLDRVVLSKLGMIPWGHHIIIQQYNKEPIKAIFYINQTIENNWSRSVLQMQIESKLFERQGKAVNNFKLTLPKPQSDLANQLLKDPYNFSFLTLENDVQELELERQLVKNISHFILELGKGFAYMGRQFPLRVNNKEYRLDLLFYHVKLKCYFVIELKTRDFEPEFVGKLNFYLSAIDSLIKEDTDEPTIGMLLCKTKDNLNVEFALRDLNKPIGVSEFTFNELPENLQKSLPTVEELERELFFKIRKTNKSLKII